MNEPKAKTQIQNRIDSLLNTAAVLEKIEGTVPETVLFGADDAHIRFWPNEEKTARKIVGSLIMRLQAKPTIEKLGSTQLMAVFNYAGVTLTIYGYRGRKCAVVKKEVVHEAEDEKIIPAKAAWVETVEELVCEMPAVEAEVGADAAKVISEEVPF